jgi:hypothetical protein
VRNNEVKIGGVYWAKVSERIVKVRVVSESTFGGWQAVNERTGRQILIRSGRRLRGEADVSSIVKNIRPTGTATGQ